MNKYLKKFNEISENVGGYTELTRCLIADEFDCYYGGYYEDENYGELTAEQEEYLINIIYDYYIDTEDINLFRATKGVVDTLLGYSSFEEFKKDYEDEEKYSQIMDNISWNATSY